MTDTFPRQHARTQRLTLGEPRSFTIAGGRLLFTRSHGESDPVNTLWVLEPDTGTEREVLDPRTLPLDGHDLTEAEKRRRERAREGAGGIVTYSCDGAGARVVTVVGGVVVVVEIATGEARVLPVEPGVFDARLSPDGTRIAYVRGRDLCVCDLDGSETRLAHEENPDISWGSAEFIAAEEMGRQRGYWWSPDSTSLAACRVDVSPVATWWIADLCERHMGRHDRLCGERGECSLALPHAPCERGARCRQRCMAHHMPGIATHHGGDTLLWRECSDLAGGGVESVCAQAPWHSRVVRGEEHRITGRYHAAHLHRIGRHHGAVHQNPAQAAAIGTGHQPARVVERRLAWHQFDPAIVVVGEDHL
ncbi:MAG: DPP IV N-terminal domain-containing protein [Actinomycetota bacterium]